MPEFALEFEVFCSCGEGLCNQSDTRTSYGRRMPQVVVQPCERCLQRARDEAWNEGYESAMQEVSDREAAEAES